MRKQLALKEDSSSSGEEEDGSKSDKSAKSDHSDGEEKKVSEKKENIHKLSKDQVHRIWDATLRDVPKDYDFIISSQQER